jgi:hypothetical protein
MIFAKVEHDTNTATVLAHQARPLQSALDAVEKEYGWVIDFEDPPYRSHFDLVDNTDPAWRASHPLEKGVTRIAGEAFQSQFPDGPDVNTAAGEERALNKIISDYNASGNPGKFILRRESEGRYAVIGQTVKDDNGGDREVSSILDTPISIPSQTRGGIQTVELILSTLSLKSGQHAALMSYPANVFRPARITIGGSDVPARQLLVQALDQMDSWYTMMWDLLFSFDQNTFFLNVGVQSKVMISPTGKKRLVAVHRNQQ